VKHWLSPVILSVLLAACGSDPVPDEPFYQEQWALHYDQPFYEAYAIAPDAHIHGESTLRKYRGKGVKIAVIDVGVDSQHPEFQSNIIKTINSRDGSADVACIGSASCFHGTAITGVIASNINGIGLRGIAPQADIVFIKLDLNGFLSDNEILDALNYAEAENVDVINCSWGTGNVSPIVQRKIDQMATAGRGGKGTIFVFAIGNQGQGLTNDESLLDSVIGVGSSDEGNLRAIYSNFGLGLDIVAPGGFTLGITTAYPANTSTHPSHYMKAEDAQKFQGTSSSAPIVAAAVALMLEADPTLTRVDIQSILRAHADKIGSIAYVGGKNDYYGYGKLNLDASLVRIRNP